MTKQLNLTGSNDEFVQSMIDVQDERAESMIPVQYTRTRIAFADFESSGNAQPTSCVLHGSADHGYAQEWAEPGHVVIDGERRPASMVYLFDVVDCNHEDAADYPWDAEHAVRILLGD